MFRLTQSAFDILKTEILRCTATDLVGQVQRDIALRRLEKLRAQSGTPLSLEELRETIVDLFPNFSETVLKAADRANRPSAAKHHVNLAAVLVAGIAGLAGGLWVLNLPYPPIRWTVARVAPMVLLPSFMSMDTHYRQAIAATEQADQLVNQATSAADLDLGTTKVKTAQKSLDALPVWFLGYYPQAYCHWSQCTWRFTLDEFQSARKEVARMDAKLFQEKNAQTQLNQAEQALSNAKQQYQEAPNAAEKQDAIAQWQQAIDLFHQIPAQTLADRLAQPKLTAYDRDFQQVVGFAAGSTRTGSLTQAAQAFATKAQQFSAGTAHTADEWEEVQNLWQTAIERLNKVEDNAPDYNKAQTLLADYNAKLARIRIRLKEEQASVQAYKEAQQRRNNLFDSIPSNAKSLSFAQVGQLRQIVDTLKTVRPGTTVYTEAQTMLKAAEAKLK